MTGWASIDDAIQIRSGQCTCGPTCKTKSSCLRCITEIVRRCKDDGRLNGLDEAADLLDRLGATDLATLVRAQRTKHSAGCGLADVLAAAERFDRDGLSPRSTR